MSRYTFDINDGIPEFLLRKANPVQESSVMSEQVESVSEDVKPKAKAKAKAPAKKAAPVKAKPEKAAKAPAKKAKPVKEAKAKPEKASKVAKPKTEKKSKAEKDQWGLRKGSAKSEAVSMYARKNGATLEEVKDKIGSIQLNVLKELEAEGHTVEREKIERKGQRPLTRYKLIAK